MNDVNQGAAPDCWCMATLMAAVSAEKSIFANIMAQTGPNTFTVQLYKQHREIDPKSNLPTRKGDTNRSAINVTLNSSTLGGSVFSGDQDSAGKFEVWTQVMEIAILQVWDEYKAEMAGEANPVPANAHWGLKTIFGDRYTGTVQKNDPFKDIGELKDALAKGPVTYTVKDSTDAYTPPAPLIPHHYFLVESVHEDGTVTLRNPWGYGNITVQFAVLNDQRNGLFMTIEVTP